MQWEIVEGYGQRSDVIQFVLRRFLWVWGRMNEKGRAGSKGEAGGPVRMHL